MEDFHVDAEGCLGRIRSAVDSVRSEVRGLPQLQAEERLVRALQSHDAFLSGSQLRLLAWRLRDPWWSWVHPFKAWRHVRGESARPDVESGRFQAEANRLARTLDGFEGISTVSSMRTMDGDVHVVTISPWSDDLARRVRDEVAPTTVTVRPARDAP